MRRSMLAGALGIDARGLDSAAVKICITAVIALGGGGVPMFLVKRRGASLARS